MVVVQLRAVRTLGEKAPIDRFGGLMIAGGARAPGPGLLSPAVGPQIFDSDEKGVRVRGRPER